MVTPINQLAIKLGLLRPAEFLKAFVETHAIVAAVAIGFRASIARQYGRQRIGHFRIGHQIAPTQGKAIHAKARSGEVHQALDEKRAFIATGTAISSRRRLVADIGVGLQMDGGNAIGAGHELRGVAHGRHAIGADIGAHIDEEIAAHAQQCSILAEGELDIAFGFAGMTDGGEMFAPILDPAYGLVKLAGGEGDEKVFGIELAARAKATAHVHLDIIDGGLRQAHQVRHGLAIEEGQLGRAIDREMVALRIPFRQQAARLHGQRGLALGGELAANRHISRSESRIHFALVGMKDGGDIAAGMIEEHHRIAHAGLAINGGGQLLDIEHNRRQRILGNLRRLRENDGDRLAEITHLAAGDDGLCVGPDGGVGATEGYLGDLAFDIRRCENRFHAGPCEGRRTIDVPDHAMADGAAHKGRMPLPFAHEVADILAFAAQETIVFDALDGAADIGVDGSHAWALRA